MAGSRLGPTQRKVLLMLPRIVDGVDYLVRMNGWCWRITDAGRQALREDDGG